MIEVPTPLLSNHTVGAGIGFAFDQSNPPGPLPEPVGNAFNLYSAWSTGQSSEPLPKLRDFILDRNNLSSIGDFSVGAIEARRKVNCSGFPIVFAGDVHGDPSTTMDVYYNVSTSCLGDVQLRAQTQLTLWVDCQYNTSASRAFTRIVFAALGGDIERGHHNALTNGLNSFCKENCSSISSLACDVDIELFDSKACTQDCDNVNATLTSMETLTAPGNEAFSPQPRYTWTIAAYIAAAPTIFGFCVYGRQRMCTNQRGVAWFCWYSTCTPSTTAHGV